MVRTINQGRTRPWAISTHCGIEALTKRIIFHSLSTTVSHVVNVKLYQLMAWLVIRQVVRMKSKIVGNAAIQTHKVHVALNLNTNNPTTNQGNHDMEILLAAIIIILAWEDTPDDEY